MFDSKGRKIHYLRLSVTDLCNLRCRYCMPDGVDKLEREDILTYEEFLRLAALFARCGVDTVRVTGGEPLVRKGVEQLVRGLKAIPGIRKVTMTTNAVLLEHQLPALLDTLDAHGALSRSALVCSCGLPDETIFPDLSTARPPQDGSKAGYFATVLVKE